MNVEQKTLTVNARGEICGSIEGIDPEQLNQLTSPEGKERIRKMYKDAHGTGRRELRRAIELNSEHRDFRHLMPPGMSNTEFKHLRRQFMRKMSKTALRTQRSQRNANQSV